MHLLIIILQQLLGMLPSSKQATQAEVVRRERPQPKGADGDACLLRVAVEEQPGGALLGGGFGQG